MSRIWSKVLLMLICDNIALLKTWHFKTMVDNKMLLITSVQIGIGEVANSHDRRSNFCNVNVHLLSSGILF